MKTIIIQLCYILFLSVYTTSCMAQQGDELIGTKWVFSFDCCQEYWRFKEQRLYEFYSCETGDTIFGTYELEGSQLIIHQLEGSYDQEFPEESKHRTPNVKFELEVDEKKMMFKERWEKDAKGNWIKSDFSFSGDYVFKKQ